MKREELLFALATLLDKSLAQKSQSRPAKPETAKPAKPKNPEMPQEVYTQSWNGRQRLYWRLASKPAPEVRAYIKSAGNGRMWRWLDTDRNGVSIMAWHGLDNAENRAWLKAFFANPPVTPKAQSKLETFRVNVSKPAEKPVEIIKTPVAL